MDDTGIRVTDESTMEGGTKITVDFGQKMSQMDEMVRGIQEFIQTIPPMKMKAEMTREEYDGWENQDQETKETFRRTIKETCSREAELHQREAEPHQMVGIVIQTPEGQVLSFGRRVSEGEWEFMDIEKPLRKFFK